MRTRVKAGVVLGCAALGAAVASCSFSRFDDLRDDAKAQALSNPFGGSDFGGVLLTTRPATGEPRLAVVAAGGAHDVAFYTFTQSGSENLIKLRGGASDRSDTTKLDTNGGPPIAMAAAPNGLFAAVVGIPGGRDRFFYFMTFDAAGKPQVASSVTPGFAGGFGRAAAYGDVYRPLGAPMTDTGMDGMVLADREIFMYPQQVADTSVGRCTIGVNDLAAGALLVHDFVPGGNGLSEVALGEVRGGGPGKVSILTLADIEEPQLIGNSIMQSTKNCTVLGTAISAPGNESSFGKVLAVGNLFGSADPELLVGAPAENVVYVFEGTPTGPVVAGFKKLTVQTTGEFGSAITVLDLDGDGKNEIAIGEPKFSADAGHNESGRVHVMALKTDGNFVTAGTLSDKNPSGEARFGRSVAALKFTGQGGKTVDELVVGLQEEVFVYFDTGIKFTQDGAVVMDADDRIR